MVEVINQLGQRIIDYKLIAADKVIIMYQYYLIVFDSATKE